MMHGSLIVAMEVQKVHAAETAAITTVSKDKESYLPLQSHRSDRLLL